MNKFYDGQAFLQSWKAGVKLAGPKWFGDGNDPETAETKWDLAPCVDFIEANIGYLSTSEAVFLAAMVSFYNDRIGAPLLQSVVGYDDDDGMADRKPASVLLRLVEAMREVPIPSFVRSTEEPLNP